MADHRPLLSLLVGTVLLPLSACGSSTQVWFTPSTEIRDALDAEFSVAESYIHVAIFTFTDAEIATALKDASRRVEIKLCADQEQTDYAISGQFDLLEDLESAGIEVRKGNGEDGGILHDKYAVIDGRLVFTGSFNYTQSAVERNRENLVLINDADAAALYEENFQQVWAACVDLHEGAEKR